MRIRAGRICSRRTVRIREPLNNVERPGEGWYEFGQREVIPPNYDSGSLTMTSSLSVNRTSASSTQGINRGCMSTDPNGKGIQQRWGEILGFVGEPNES